MQNNDVGSLSCAKDDNFITIDFLDAVTDYLFLSLYAFLHLVTNTLFLLKYILLHLAIDAFFLSNDITVLQKCLCSSFFMKIFIAIFILEFKIISITIFIVYLLQYLFSKRFIN